MIALQIEVIEILSSFFNQKIKNNHFFCLFSYSFYPKLLCKIQIKFIVWKSFCCFQLCMLWLWDRKSFLNPKQNYSIHGFLQCKNLVSLMKILRLILFFIFLSPHFPKQNLASDYQKLSWFSYCPAPLQIKQPIQKRKRFLFLLDTCFHQSLYTTSGFADFLKRWFYLWIFFNIFFRINLKTPQRSQIFFVLHENFISFLDEKVICWITIYPCFFAW